MNPSWIKYYLLIAFTFNISLCYAQINGGGLSQDSTLLDEEIYSAEDVERNKDGFFSMFEGDPGRAALYSALIPGGGQIYNKRWLKAPIVWGLEGTAIGFMIFCNTEFKYYDLGYKGMVRGEITEYGTGNNKFTDSAGLKQRRDLFRKYRDYSIIGLAAAHVLSIADAFVDRHLLEFDVDEDISIELGPTQHGVGLTFAF